ncbi:uncharacterized protein LOC127874844 [Dreissena polymorpha]|uniref:B box-type domain-containing protein n=1 Tax=Dreissena polymorpha TaxID=45954 RepID=A0A9D4R2N8_DREPO|nr:uncharacterized protein LOC127874844 [Dreissena polymorpha]KAH3851953.1 hypothetical protein DPMN_094440 [Dreissena polymorpha]
MAAAYLSLKSKDSETIAAYRCSTCKNKNTETEAKAYCKKCDSCFCEQCVNLHNQLFQNHAIYGPEEMEKWPVAMATQEFLESCEVHKGKKLTLFCADHSQMCCDTCILLSHRQCSKVTLIADATLSATDNQQISAKINSVLNQLLKLQTNWESNMKSLQVSYEERLKEIRSKRERINASLDELEKATLKEMEEVKASWNASLKFDVDTCSRLRTELTRLSDSIQEIGKKNEELAFIARLKSEELIKQADKYLNNNSMQTELSLKFIIYNDIEVYLSNLTCLGHTIHITKELTMQGSPDQAIIVTGATPVSVRTPSDTSSSYFISGMCGMFNGQILVIDYQNKRLKLLDLQHKVVSECDMSGYPWDMCVITPCQVAVAVDSCIQFVSVNSGQLMKGRRLQLQHDCKGVAHHQGDLYVTSSGQALYKYTLTGTLVNKMYEDTSNSLTVWGCAVSPSGDRIYVTIRNQHKLLTLAKDGAVISTFTDTELAYPYGVNVTPAGQVLVCGRNSNTVIQVDREGKKKIATLATQKDGLKSGAVSVFYNQKTGSVIVGQRNNENILVFNLK